MGRLPKEGRASPYLALGHMAQAIAAVCEIAWANANENMLKAGNGVRHPIQGDNTSGQSKTAKSKPNATIREK
jgi:hypothetical protein